MWPILLYYKYNNEVNYENESSLFRMQKQHQVCEPTWSHLASYGLCLLCQVLAKEKKVYNCKEVGRLITKIRN